MKHTPRFFVSPEQITGSTAILRGRDVQHLTSVLRLRQGAVVELLDGLNHLYQAELQQTSREQALFKILSRVEIDTEPHLEVVLGAALLKGEKFDYLIQKATELGVHRIIPFISTRTVTRISPEKETGRVRRWQKIAQEAAEQSERGKIPVIDEPLTFNDLCDLDLFDLKLICAERGDFPGLKRVLQAHKPPGRVLALVGPEGGFSPEELQLAREKSFLPVSLGKRILRAETASLLLLSNLFYELENES